jgi:hypothetical protein
MPANDWAAIERIEPRVAAPLAPGLRTAIFNTLFFTAIALVYLLRRPFLPLVLLHIALPWITVALAVRFPESFTLSIPKKNLPRSGFALVWPYVAFCSLAVFDTTRVVSLRQAVYLGCIPGAVFSVTVILVQRRCRAGINVPGFIALALFSAVYGYGSVRELNIVLDRSPGIAHPAIVLARSYARGGYALRLAPWELADSSDTIHVPVSLYRSIHMRDRVCMVLKQGALGMSWYSAQACPWDGKIEFP